MAVVIKQNALHTRRDLARPLSLQLYVSTGPKKLLLQVCQYSLPYSFYIMCKLLSSSAHKSDQICLLYKVKLKNTILQNDMLQVWDGEKHEPLQQLLIWINPVHAMDASQEATLSQLATQPQHSIQINCKLAKLAFLA